MNNKSRKKAGFIVFLCSITYMISYITRINFGAVISEMQTATGISKELLSMSLTGSVITYGVGQIVSGAMGDRISPKRLVTYGMVVTSVMNFLIPICRNPYQMLCVWSINGFAQSFMWPPMVKILTSALTDEQYRRAVSKVSYGSTFGTIFVYFTAPMFISIFGWKSVFLSSGIMGFIMLFVWNGYACDVKLEKREKTKTDKGVGMFFSPILLGIMLGIILQGMLRDGVTTWMPSYIAETYNLSNEISILTGVVLPIFGMLCFHLATKLYTTKLKNPMSCAALFFCAGTLAAMLLSMFTGKNAAASVISSAVLSGCMHGVNLMLICMVPQYFKGSGKVSFMSGVLNSCTYIGSAASTYGIALLSERIGWSGTVVSWIIVAFLGTAVCFAVSLRWNKYKESIGAAE